MRSTFSRSFFPYWTIPLIYVAATIALAFTLPRVEYKFLPGLSHSMAGSSAVAIFSSIASGMIALTGIVFSLAFVMIQFSSSAYSQRLVYWFSSNPVIFHSLGLFSATFIYALASLAWVDREGSGRVPVIGTGVVFLLLTLSVLALVVLIRDISELQVTRVLHFIGHRGRVSIREVYPSNERPFLDIDSSSGAENQPVTQTLYFSGGPLVIAAIDIHALVRMAREAEGLIVLNRAVGDAAMEGPPLMQIHGGKRLLPESGLAKAIILARDRTFDQDPRYAIRLLVDISIKALSPAINDPTTATQAIDQIEDLLRRLAVCNLEIGRVKDGEGTLRLIFPAPDWEDYLSLALDEISFYGASSLQVIRKLRSALSELAEIAQPPKKGAVLSYLEHLDDIVNRTFTDEHDRNKAKQEDRQGLGSTFRRRGKD